MQEHIEAVQKEKNQAEDFAGVMESRNPREAPAPNPKRTKLTESCLTGKRVLDLGIAQTLKPEYSYLYETTDGKRIRIFYGRNRRSTSSMISIGKGTAILKCIKWAWFQHEKSLAGIVCPFNLDVIKCGCPFNKPGCPGHMVYDVCV